MSERTRRRTDAYKHLEEETLGKAYDSRLMSRLMHYLAPSRGLVAGATALLILFSLAQLAGPIITKIAIDRYITTGDYPGLLRIVLLWFLLIGVSAFLQYAQLVSMNLIGQRAMRQLRDELYRHVQRLPMSFFDKNPVGRLMTRLTNDVEVLNQMFTQGVVAIFGDVFTLLGIMVVLIVMDWRLALVTFAAVPVLVIVTLQFRRRLRTAYRDIRVALAKINAYLQESLGGIPLIKALRREERNNEEFQALAADHRDAFLGAVRAFATYYPLVEVVEAVAVALVLWYGGGRVIQDAITFGALVAFIQYAGRFFRPIRDLTDKYNILQDAMASSERIFNLLDRPVEMDATTTPAFDPAGAIRYENVHFSYDGQTPVLQGIDIEIPPGKTTAIVGSTGSGKTTLMALLSRFYPPTTGRITLGGVDIADIPRRVLRRHLAVVQQDVFLFSGTVEENIRLWEEIPEERLQRAVELSHADHLISRLSQGLKHTVTERGGTFSTGERQLVAFARALAFDPDILILDEATAAIDSETEALIQDALRRLLTGRTAIVIAHRLSTIRHADQILVLHHGRVCERGRHEELLKAGGIYARLYRLQFELQHASADEAADGEAGADGTRDAEAADGDSAGDAHGGSRPVTTAPGRAPRTPQE